MDLDFQEERQQVAGGHNEEVGGTVGQIGQYFMEEDWWLGQGLGLAGRGGLLGLG